MSAWLRSHLMSLVATVSRLARKPVATLLNALVIGVALALPLGAWVLVKNAERLAAKLGANPQLSAFFAPDAGKADFARVEAALTGAPGVRRFRFVSKDEALAEMKRVDGLGELAATLGSNPLPDAFVVELAPDHLQAVERVAAALRGLPKVAQVQLDSVWVRRLDAMLRVGSVAVGLLAGLLAFGLIAVTFNTIRLQILTQRDEIEVSRLVGATDAHIRRPFFYLGALLGLSGGVAALAMLGASAWLLNTEIANLAATYGSAFRLEPPPVLDLVAVMGFAALLGWSGAFLSVSRHLAEIKPR